MLRPDVPELWGGLECTINRVGDTYKDQLDLVGHYRREDDISMVGALGFKQLRYPILWERHQSPPAAGINWNFTATRLREIVECGMNPIAGLLHHGSGPRTTSLSDPWFSSQFAGYARQVAETFPWLDSYTPINEPLTTARFSGLYGHWYPHRKSCYDFLQMLVNQVKGVVLAMKEIRHVNPSAKLVQTEDLAKIHATPLLQYQADFENERRWLTFDLLCGRLTKHHPLWHYMRSNGVTEKQLAFFVENVCPPDVMGLNYYVTSERWLDEDTRKYPENTHGGNGFHLYADTEAVRADSNAMQGGSILLQEAWQRFKIPIAITEAHIDCTREEQLRWLQQLWTTGCDLRAKGIDFVALTAWNLLGSFDWNSLLTENNDHYEPGLFDIRPATPRITATGTMVASLAKTQVYRHPLISQTGWWQRKRRPALLEQSGKSLVIIGKTGTLGNAFAKICAARSIPFVALSRADCDIEKQDDIQRMLDHYQPWAVINATGYVKVDEAEHSKDLCFRLNALAPGRLGGACKEAGAKMLTFSSDLVFNGKQSIPYVESDEPHPLNVYGRSKLAGERAALDADSNALIIRSSTFFGPWDAYNFIHDIVKRLSLGDQIEFADDVHISPTYVPDLVNAALDLLIDDASGIWHLANNGSVNWAELAADIAERNGFLRSQIIPVPGASLSTPAKRPSYSVLSSNNGILLRPLSAAIDTFMKEQQNTDPAIVRLSKYFQHQKNI